MSARGLTILLLFWVMVSVIRTLSREVYQEWEVRAGRSHPSGNPTRPLNGCPMGVFPVDSIVEVVLWSMKYAVDVALRSLPEWKRGKPG